MDDKKRACRILLVDDEVAITANLAPFLERAGFCVTIAEDGESALKRVKGACPDLVVLDVQLPDMNGFQVCQDSNYSQHC
jgi:DNA-binding response OmpR family regulator